MLIFIDSGIDDRQTLINEISSINDVEIIMLNSDQSGVEQITHAILQRTEMSNLRIIHSVHIITRSKAGRFHLGSTQLSLNTLSYYATQLQDWAKASLVSNAQIRAVPASGAGRKLMQQLSHLAGRTVTVSINLLNNAVDETWDFEVQIGQDLFADW